MENDELVELELMPIEMGFDLPNRWQHGDPRPCFDKGIIERLDEENLAEEEILSIGREDSPYVLHLLARADMKLGEYEKAYSHLYRVLMGTASIPQPMLYFVFCDLEIACKERGDFKGAYEYSINKLELLQKLLG